MKLHIAMGDHRVVVGEQCVDGSIGLAQRLHRIVQLDGLDASLMSQHGELIQVPAAAPKFRQDGLQLLYHMDCLPLGGVQQILPLAQTRLSDYGVDLPPLRGRHPEGDDVASLSVRHVDIPSLT